VSIVEHRRQDRRYERRVPIDVQFDGGALSTHTRNISLGGVYVESERQLPFGTKVHLKFRVPSQTDVIEVDGQVRWVEMEEGHVKGIGIRFEGLRARDVWALNKFFEKPVEGGG
jgi:uncharacterized protein (TIGR02266 family)